MIDYNIIEELKNAPLLLLTIKDEETIDYFNSLIPYSTGFEIECDKGENYDEESFRVIPDIMDIQNDSYEQRYRIPNGIRGMICLYNICEQLKVNSALNPLSGIHYHIDCTECWNELKNLSISNFNWILKELDEWDYKGAYNTRNIGNGFYWVRTNSLQTLEFRIGEMTFDYSLMLKRIIHCNNIVSRLKNQISHLIPIHKLNSNYIAPNARAILEYIKKIDFRRNNRATNLNKKLLSLEQDLAKKEEKRESESIVVKNRIHKIE